MALAGLLSHQFHGIPLGLIVWIFKAGIKCEETEADVRSGSFAPFWLCLDVRFAPNNDRMADIRKRSEHANRRHQREALWRGALYWKTGLSYALDAAFEIIWIPKRQDAPSPLD